MPGETAASRYDKLELTRMPYLERARQNSLVTIPSLFPPEGQSGSSPLYKPWQSLGAYGVNNLSSKLMLGLFPPTRPFYRLVPNALAEEAQPAEAKAEIDSALAKAERRIFEEITGMRIRPAMYRGFRHLIVGGNYLVWIKDGSTVGYTLDQYVVVRSYSGKLLEVIIRELLPEDMIEEMAPDASVNGYHGPVGMPAMQIDRGMADRNERYVFTRFTLDNRIWRSYQEIDGLEVEGTRASYGRDKPAPVLAMRWHSSDGEDYGRAFADDYVGDLASLEGLAESIMRFAGVASKIIFMMETTGSTDPRDLQRAKSGDFVRGNREDVKILALEDKVFDFQVTNQVYLEIQERLRFAFLLNSAAQRDAERVTAEEIRMMMNELETAHGGVFSFFADDLQLPLVQIIMDDMRKRKLLPDLKEINVAIVTGVDALSRNQELQDMAEAFGIAGQLLGPQAMAAAVHPSEVMRRILTSKGIKLDGLLKSPEEMQQEQEQAQMAAMAEKAVGPAAGALARQATQGEPTQ